MNYFLDSWRPYFHLSPPDGWMSDPVGLCQTDGIYHVFFQYCPEDADGKKPRVWGHFMGKSLTEMKYAGIAFPLTDFEKSGAYPGSALTEDGRIWLFYTGNIKGKNFSEDRGRISNQMRLSSSDGIHFEDRTLLLSNVDYPSGVTLKVRSPRVFREKDTYFMVLASGKKAEPAGMQEGAAAAEGPGQGNGCVLVYTSRDLTDWTYLKEFSLPERFGFQWECPDYFHIGGHTVLSVCPQGVPHEEFSFQNHYSSGFFFVEGETLGGQIVHRDSFREWDKGFDFYAPQTFEDQSGRRILIAWAGMPDARYFNLTTAKEGWQGLLTVPRELSVKGGRILQNPVSEILALRDTRLTPMNGEPITYGSGTGEILIGPGEGSVRVRIGSLLQPRVVTVEYEEGVVTLSLDSSTRTLSPAAAAAAKAEGAVVSVKKFSEKMDQAREAGLAAGGRKVRKARVEKLKNLRILVDTSVIEVFINDGETVMTTRYYPNHKDAQTRIINAEYGLRSCQAWEYKAMADPFAP